MTTVYDCGEVVTLVTRMERLVEQMRAQKRQFVTDASHELGTPLAGLRLQLEEARMHPGQTDLNDLVRHALREVDRIQAIIGDMLTLARLDAGFPDPLLPIDVADLVKQEVGKRPYVLPIHLDLEEDLVVGGVNATLARLLGNLLDNAERHGRSAVRVSVSSEGGEVMLMVDDDGMGVPLPERERVFDHFARTDSARSRGHGGAGLGLSIALAIAEAHSGTLTAHESDLGGARFVLCLPLLQLDAMTGQAA
ncbi:HAMP domain-containing histidine kinase [Nonomuraea deserti]|uniref:histidine kinase n=1 Tax=Nonomuraea deserti TaxID=1848322 RepID=A0A4R4VCB3_9ACTN|nr:HAMP domain-containing sensor histidine kinase [Nonomuraea deserti]TDD02862.1 HAMP domain-containing histidine kinase [Nonomuraea deserti]